MKQIIIAALAATLLLGLAVPASAGDWGTGSGDSGGGKDDNPGNSGDPNPGGGSGSGGTAGGTSGRWSLSGTIWGNPTTKKAVAPSPAASGSKKVTLKCSGSNAWGPFLGQRWSSWGHRTSQGNDNGSYRYNFMEGASRTCIDAPHFVIETRRCVTRITGDVTWAYKRVDGKPVTTRNLGTTTTAFAKSGNKDLSKCTSEYQKHFSFDDEVWGEYRGRAAAFERVATIKRFTTPHAKSGKTPRPVLLAMGPEQKVNPVTVWWSQSCRYGVEQGRKNRDYSGNGCQGKPSTSEWKCGIAPTASPYLSGIRNSKEIEVFHDAKRRPIRFKAPKPTGDVRAFRDKSGTLNYVSGSPFRTISGSSVANAQKNSTQHFSAVPAYGTAVSGWPTTWNGQWFRAGLPGQNFKARVTYRFSAEFKHQFAIVTGIRSDGSLIYRTSTKWARSTGSCATPSTNLAITRSRTSN
ncbi:hypothetical protein [Aeromicrobium ginsengisoli]|uniref:Uncharacterized protein n=1 Tax=Aeromicrobium ginsengisoli TaxID=363867 RepID=A0A5M4FI65_9ACTN|nr:hypothetical protein [Aeromicrobium ginsengisoli]KAA1399652.1 hypothetical protein ESP70_002505 [Aeromicrobium ginsengisoli]